jgi:hypothetical protein
MAADVIGPSAVRAGWRLGDGSSLRVLCNLAGEAVAIPAEAGTPLHATPPDAAGAIAAGALPGFSTIWFLDRVAGA